jgi:hypothetical protein
MEMGEWWDIYLGICLSQLFFHILLSPGCERGEGGTIERQCILLSSERELAVDRG